MHLHCKNVYFGLAVCIRVRREKNEAQEGKRKLRRCSLKYGMRKRKRRRRRKENNVEMAE